MPIRDVVFDIYRLPKAVGEATDFERGSMFLSSGQVDSACFYFARFNKRCPENFYGQTHLAYAALINDSLEESQGIIDKLLASHPDDYRLHGFCKSFYRRAYDQTKDGKYLQLSRQHELREKQLKH
jgi:hypothetical protein